MRRNYSGCLDCSLLGLHKEQINDPPPYPPKYLQTIHLLSNKMSNVEQGIKNVEVWMLTFI